jgi:hypothetical protein
VSKAQRPVCTAHLLTMSFVPVCTSRPDGPERWTRAVLARARRTLRDTQSEHRTDCAQQWATCLPATRNTYPTAFFMLTCQAAASAQRAFDKWTNGDCKRSERTSLVGPMRGTIFRRVSLASIHRFSRARSRFDLTPPPVTGATYRPAGVQCEAWAAAISPPPMCLLIS